MSDFGKNLKNFFTRSTKFVGRNVSRFAKATKSKTNELSDLNKRRELICKLGESIYAARLKGLSLPEDAAAITEQISALDKDLEKIQAERAAQKAEYAQKRAEEKAARAAEKAAAQTAAAIEKSTAAANISIPEPVFPAFDLESAAEITDATSQQPSGTDAKGTPDVPTLNV